MTDQTGAIMPASMYDPPPLDYTCGHIMASKFEGYDPDRPTLTGEDCPYCGEALYETDDGPFCPEHCTGWQKNKGRTDWTPDYTPGQPPRPDDPF